MECIDFKKRIEIAKGLPIAKGVFEKGAFDNDLSIEWETDISKVSKVENINRYSSLKLQIKDIQISELPQFRQMELFEVIGAELTRDEASIAHTCYLIGQGVKIVPPVVINRWVIADGILKKKGRKSQHYSDGSHRVYLAKMLGYDTIPVICADILDGYSFTVDLWEFDYQKNQITAKEKNGEGEMIIKLGLGKDTFISQSNNGKIWIDYQTAHLLT